MMMTASDSRSPISWKGRWPQLTFAVLSTVMLANLQYGWTLFVNPMHDENHWSRTGIQLAFTIMIFVNTWLAPGEGWLVDRYGPRSIVLAGGFFAAASWLINSQAHSLTVLYGSAIIGGLAIGCVFGTCMGTALKWFPDKRGLAAGMIAAGYGLGAAFTSAPLAGMIRVSGYREAFRFFGLLQGFTICALALLLVKPTTPAQVSSRTVIRQGADHSLLETFRSGVFWLIYLIYLLIAVGGMVITAQLGPIARDFGLEATTVTLFGFAAPLAGWAVSIDNFANGITRPISGFLSDVIGRENAMLLMFSLEAIALFGFAIFGRHPHAFLIFAALIFLFWGEIFVLFPAISGDCFGSRNAAANNGLLYTAKGTSAIAVPLANMFVPAHGTWATLLIATALSSACAGLLAKFVLGPMRARMLEQIIDRMSGSAISSSIGNKV